MFITAKTFQNQSADDSPQWMQALCHEELVTLLARADQLNWKQSQNLFQAEHGLKELAVQLELP